MLNSKNKDKIKFWLDILVGFIGLVALVSLIANVGFYLSELQLEITWFAIETVIILFILQEASRWALSSNWKKHFRQRKLENILAFLLLLNSIFPETVFDVVSYTFPWFSIEQATILYLSLVELIIIIVLAIKVLRYNHLIARSNLHPGAILSISFLGFVVIGTILLLLPKATAPGESFSVIDALFTSTSAVCVTGLIVVDTSSAFTTFGQIVILLLIQVGGLGIMTLTTFFTAMFAGGLSFRVRILMKDLLSQESISGVKSLLLKIAFFTFLIEGVGAVLLYYSMGYTFIDMNWDVFFSAIFHSISAFCNAGFSIYGDGLMDSILIENYTFMSTIMVLIVFGGIGFVVMSNFLAYLNPFKRKLGLKQRLSTNTFIVLVSSGILLLGGAILFLIIEPYSYSDDLSFLEKIFHSLFLSVTARTAGFNTVPIASLAAPAVMLMMALMWIGASPGSTGGGIKTSTITIAFLSLFNLIRGREKVEIFYRQVSDESIHRAFLVILSSLVFLALGSLLLMIIEPDKDPIDLIFEAVSAVGTVGLSRGITFNLGVGGKMLIILLMFVGRIGVLSFLLSFGRMKRTPRYTLPNDNIIIG